MLAGTLLSAEMVSLLVEPALTGLLVNCAVNPVGGLAESVTLLEKLLTGVMLTIDALDPPG